MKKYDAKRGAVIVSSESINDGELYYYVLEAKDGIIDPKFEIKGA